MLKIAVFSATTSAVRLHEALRFMKLLRDDAGPDAPHVVFGVLGETPAERWCRRHRLPLWDELRPFTWQEMDWGSLARTFGIIAEYGRYVRPLDGGLDFRDCDFWLFTGGNPQLPLLPLVPFGLHVTEPPALVRNPVPAFGETLLKNIRNAGLVIFPTDDYARYWLDLALAHDGPVPMVGTSCVDIDVTAEDVPSGFDGGEYLLYFRTSFRFDGVPPLAHSHEEMPADEIHLIPLKRASVEWDRITKTSASWRQVNELVAQGRLVISEPLLDPCDIRLCASRRQGKRPLMLWSGKWHQPPEWLMREMPLHHDDDPLPLERRVQALLRKGADAPVKDEGGGVDGLPSLDGRALRENILKVAGK